MVNNFELIKNYLTFPTENSFYMLQLIKRKKENPDMSKNNEVIHTYYIYSKEDLDELQERIISTCNTENCRAYINVNDLDLERVALNALCETSRLIRDKEYKKIIRVWSAACGATGGSINKVWLLDFDGEEVNMKDEIVNLINSLEPNPGVNKVRLEVPTKNGLHLMVKPFNIKEFSKHYNTDDFLHKDNPTILYIP